MVLDASNGSRYLESSALIDQGVGVTSWLGEFRTAITNGMANNDPDYDQTWLDEKGDFKDKDTYYRQLHRWYRDGGLRFQGSMQWKSKACENSTLDVWETTACDPTLGLRGARAQATIALEYSDQGYTRYESMTMLRQNISGFITETSKVVMEEDSCGNTDVMGDTPAVYPFSPQFLFWEEVRAWEQHCSFMFSPWCETLERPIRPLSSPGHAFHWGDPLDHSPARGMHFIGATY